jgi:hypothetical protein
MINHARTLLLNVSNASYAPGERGEEYVPTYSELVLPTYLRTARRIIFGTDPDRVFRNYRANELMRLLHQTEFSEFVYALDPRVTYWPQSKTEFFMPQQQVITQKILGQYETKINIVGIPKPDNVRGRAYREYTVKISGAVGAEIVTITSATTQEQVEVPLTWLQNNQQVLRLQAGDVGTRGISEAVDLFDGFLKVQFADAPAKPPQLALENNSPIIGEDYLAETVELEPGEDIVQQQLRRMGLVDDTTLALWRLLVYAKPDSAITVCLPRLEFLGEPFYLELFGVSDVEPYATFKNIWFDHPNAVYRMGAFVMAMIYRTNEVYGASNGR